jgi:hypothetical protein
MQSWVQRSGLHCEYFAGPAADHLCNGVTVHGTRRSARHATVRSCMLLEVFIVMRLRGPIWANAPRQPWC